MNFLKRHLRTYAALVRFSLSRTLEFRVDFFFRFFMDCIFYALSIAFFEVLFLHTDHLGGWQRHEVLLFVSGGLLLDGVFMTIIARNVWELPRLVNKGELDFQILRPVSPLFFVMTRHFEFSSLMNVFLAIGIMAYAVNLFPEPLSAAQLAGFLFLLANGFILMTAMRMFTVLPVFWTHSDLGFHMLYMSLEQVSERPEVIFRGLTHLLFTTLLPFIVITSFPARWFFGSLSWLEFSYAVALSVGFFGLMVFIWGRGLRVYSSASS
ncbi:MAG: ABC-2 family transporter protein [Deltaproteobacteria bacterium]|nr:ABC-2 family transporter protein [Deltaproteobacteria bacterium]